MNQDDIYISIDRLTRFKYPEEKYYRVFEEILYKYSISPKLSKKQIAMLDLSYISEYAALILNDSIDKLYPKIKSDFLYSLFCNFETNTFKIDFQSQKLMHSKLNFDQFFNCLNPNQQLPNNLLLYKCLLLKKSEAKDIAKFRRKFKTKFPISKLVLVEGITEEILLPIFAKLSGFDFDKEGVYVLATGGKSKIIKYYLQYNKSLKIPIFILLDKDAQQVYSNAKSLLRPNDKIHIIKNGEFEDILPKKLLKRALNSSYYDITSIKLPELNINVPACKILEEIYKKHSLGEYQKAEFAKIVAETTKYKTDISDEIKEIISFIRLL